MAAAWRIGSLGEYFKCLVSVGLGVFNPSMQFSNVPATIMLLDLQRAQDKLKRLLLVVAEYYKEIEPSWGLTGADAGKGKRSQ